MGVITIGLQIKNPSGVLISCNPAGVRFLFKYRVIYKQRIPPGFIYISKSYRVSDVSHNPVGVVYKQGTPNGVHGCA
jgi:hypothetical protein